MSLLDQIKALFSGGGVPDAGSSYAVRCSRCGEVIRVRADRRFDLEQAFDPERDTVTGYVLNKEILGQRCQQLLRLTVHFDRSYRETGRELEGGEFVEEGH